MQAVLLAGNQAEKSVRRDVRLSVVQVHAEVAPQLADQTHSEYSTDLHWLAGQGLAQQ